MTYKKIIKFILLISWMSIIFYFSNQKADDSSKLSNGIIVKITKVFVKDKISKTEKEKILEKYVTLVRKSAHAFVYFALALIAFSFFKEFYGISKKTFFYTILLCFCYSVSDEFHQLFIEGRSGEANDILLDTTSSAITTSINYKIRMLKRRKK